MEQLVGLIAPQPIPYPDSWLFHPFGLLDPAG